METIDRKFTFLAVNPVNGNTYTEKNALILCAKDAAVPDALRAYHKKIIELKANPHHIASIELLILRVEKHQETVEKRIPDTVAEEIPRCINGIGTQFDIVGLICVAMMAIECELGRSEAKPNPDSETSNYNMGYQDGLKYAYKQFENHPLYQNAK